MTAHIRRRALLTLALVAVALVEPARAAPPSVPPVYAIDTAHSSLEFAVRLVGFNRVRGTFKEYVGHVAYDPDSVSRSTVSVRIDVASISTLVDERDKHLQTADFFDVSRFPWIRFQSRQVSPTPDGFAAIGDLTIRDVTRSVAIPFQITSPVGTDPFGNQRFSVAGHITLSRSDYGVLGPKFWNQAISDSAEVEFELGFRRWNYENLGWSGSPERPSIGRYIMDKAGQKDVSQALEEARKLHPKAGESPAYNFGLFEYMKCAGRLAQHDRLRDAAAVLEQGIDLAPPDADSSDLAAMRCQRAEILLRSGNSRQARDELAKAASEDSTNTNVRVLEGTLQP